MCSSGYRRRMETEEPTTEQLRRAQEVREELEREGQADSLTEAEADAHRRRAEKAAYLQEKLAEREQSEQAAEASEPDAA
jgi:hypothetical protein